MSKEEKALEEAIQSKKLSELRQFISTYPDAEPLLLDSAKVLLKEWESDSTDYALLKQMEDIVERAGAEMSYMDQHPEGLFIDSVTLMYQTDEGLAAEIVARQEAIERHLETYRKAFGKYVFYYDPYHYIILTEPDDKGKGQGTFADGILTYYDFHYAINLDDFEDEDIQCDYDKYNDAHFTLSLWDKSLHMQSKGDITSFEGEVDKTTRNSFLERVKMINNGEEVYGNPSVFITTED